MIKGKEAYLKKLTANMYFPSQDVGKELDGSTPPSVFIGSWNYPKVYAGPMIAPQHGNTTIMDRPESWIPEKKTQEEIIRYRLNLIRGKRSVKVTQLENPFIDKLRDISLSTSSIESEVEFGHAPKGMSFSDEHTPFGPSAPLERFDIDNARWDQDLEKVYYDGDLLAADAVVDLHQKGLPFSSIQKAFSVGAMGTKKRRRLVPTRWSITACDSTLGNRLLQKVRDYDVIERCEVREFASLNNYYAVMLLPTAWQYEWMEAFLRIMGNEELIFSDFENNGGKKGYSRVGGCYYSCKMAVLEALAAREEAGRSDHPEGSVQRICSFGCLQCQREREECYAPTNHWSLKTCLAALGHISTKLELPVKRFISQSDLLREQLKSRQTTLSSFS